MNTLKGLGLIGLALTVIFGGIYIEMYRFSDCKKVGHGTFYCILNMGK